MLYRKIYVVLIFLIAGFQMSAQVYDNYSNAIDRSNSSIVAWASSCVVERGYINISNEDQTYSLGEVTSNRAFSGSEQDACGAADGLTTLSLGDGGSAVLQFQNPIANGEGYDFVVFENAFFNPPGETSEAFIELAFVEISSDGINFFRFPCLSEMPYLVQTGSFAASDWTLYHGFAGIYTFPYGLGFDIADISDDALLNKQRITHVKIIDVVGCIQPEYATYDSQGNIVNDPWPTPFHTCGFDLDAVGVIHETQNSVNEFSTHSVSLFPNPATDRVWLSGVEQVVQLEVYDISGNRLMQFFETDSFSTEMLSAGCYVVKAYFDDGSWLTLKMMHY